MSRMSIQKYHDMKVNSAKNADPYELVQMVLKAILGKITAATVCIERNDIPNKGILISDSITLISSLEASLDMEKGGEISTNLSDLYNFCTNHLLQANIDNDVKKIEEVHTIISTIKEGWDQIPKSSRDEYADRNVANG